MVKLLTTTALTTGLQHSAAQRQRGVTLTEAILYLIIAASAIVLVAGLIFNEQQRQSDVITANANRVILEQAQNFIATEYDEVRQEAFETGIAESDNLVGLTYSMQDLSNAGYLPASFLQDGTVTNSFGQEYFLMVRGVNRSDTSEPKDTLLVSDFTGVSTWSDFVDDFGDDWLDPNPSAGEDRFDLEAVIVTEGGDRIPPNRGNRIASASGIATAGYAQLTDPITLSGAFDSYQLDISAFSFLEDFPSAPGASDDAEWVGSVGGIVALSGFNDLIGPSGEGETIVVDGGDGINNFIFRCADEDDPDHPDQPNPYDYDVCLDDDTAEVYQNIVFNDANVNAAIENIAEFIMRDGGAIRNVEEIELSDGGVIEGVALTLNMGGGTINNPQTINMEPGGDINVEGGTIDMGDGDITNVTSMTFGADCGLDRVGSQDLLIDCDTEIAGTLLVQNDTTLEEDLTVGGDVAIEGTRVDFTEENVSLEADGGALTVADRMRVGDTDGFDQDTLDDASITTEGDIFVGDAPRENFDPDNPGVAIRSEGDFGKGTVEADDFVLRGINHEDGGFGLNETIVNAIDLLPNENDNAELLPLPTCDGTADGEPEVYASVNAASSRFIVPESEFGSRGLDQSSVPSSAQLDPAPNSDYQRYEDQPILGFRYVTELLPNETNPENARFYLIGRFANLEEETIDPDPATTPVVELYLDSGPTNENRIAAFTRCAPPV